MVLEALAHIVAVAPSPPAGRAKSVTSPDLRRIATRGFRLMSSSLDPPEQPFAARILWRNVGVTTPLGLVVGSSYDLQRSLDVLDRLAETEAPLSSLVQTAELVLRMVGEMAGRAGLVGIVEPTGQHDQVTFPSADRSRRLRQAVRFSQADLRELGGDEWRRKLESLAVHMPLVEAGWDGHDGTLSYRPFVLTADGGVLVAVPGMVIPAPDRYLRSALASECDDWPARIEGALWSDIDRSLNLQGIRRAHPTIETDGSPRTHRLYRIDEEQFLGVVLATVQTNDSEAAVAAARRDLQARGGEQVLIVIFAPEAGVGAFFGLDQAPSGIVELLMKPEELSVFARVAGGEPRTLPEFAKASSAIREELRIFSWCALDEFAVYRKHQSSYYLSDERRPTLITVAPGSALNLRVEADRRSEQDLVTSPTGQPTVVMRRWEGHDGVWAPTSPLLGQGALMVRTEPPVWVLTPPYADIDSALVDGWLAVAEATAYWVFEARDVIGQMLRFAGLSHAMVTIEGVDTWTELEEADEDSANIRLRVLPEDSVVRMRLERGFATLTQAADNQADIELLSAIVEGVARLTSFPRLEDVARTIQEVVPLGQKKMVIVLNLAANPDIGPNDVPRWRRVRDAQVSIVLDELGLALRERGWSFSPEDTSGEPNRILNDAVTILVGRLGEEIDQFDPSLLEALLLRNESVLRERADAGFHLIPHLACFPGELADAYKRVDGIDAVSVAGRFLIEYVSARPPTGRRAPSLGVLDRLTALADTLVTRGQASDFEHRGLAKTNARILESGRLGVNDRELSSAWRAFLPSVQLSRTEEARESFMARWRSTSGAVDKDLEALDRACTAEWGYTFQDLGRVVGAAVSLSEEAGAPVMSLPAATAAETLAREAEIDAGIVALVLEHLSLTPRDDYLVPPHGFQPIDLYPWRYNRGLSYLRRPFVLRPANGSRDLVFGRRALLESLHYLLELVETSRLRPVSHVMKDYIGARSAARGRAFNDLVADELAAILGRPVAASRKSAGRRSRMNSAKSATSTSSGSIRTPKFCGRSSARPWPPLELLWRSPMNSTRSSVKPIASAISAGTRR